MKFNSLFFRSEKDLKGKSRNPLLYVGSLYFAEGLPYILVNSITVVMFVKMDVPNSQLALFTSLLTWPWILKMFWAPVVDKYSTKRYWIIYMQLFCAVSFALVAWSIQADAFFKLTLIVFSITAFISATHDIAIDGFYMLALAGKQQAFFIGIRSTFYRFAILFEGVLVFIAGFSEIRYGIHTSWTIVFIICFLIFLALAGFHLWYLPRPASDSHRKLRQQETIAAQNTNITFLCHYFNVFKQFFAQKDIIPILAFILLYRFGEGMIAKMITPFLISAPDTGALGISTINYSLIKSTFGGIGLIVGGIFGGLMIARYGLRKCIWPMAIALNVPNLLYVYLAYAKPELTIIGIAVIGIVVTVEMIGYGFGFSAFMMFLITISKGENRTSLYAIATGIMAFGLMVPGAVSGFLQEWLGYQYFFIAVTIVTIPGMITILFIPIEEQEKSNNE